MENKATEGKGENTGTRNTHAIVLAVIGVVLLVLGILIVSVHGAPLRGSGVWHHCDYRRHHPAGDCLAQGVT